MGSEAWKSGQIDFRGLGGPNEEKISVPVSPKNWLGPTPGAPPSTGSPGVVIFPNRLNPIALSAA